MIGFKIFIYFHDCFNTYFLAIYIFKGKNVHILIFSIKISHSKLLYRLTVNLLIKRLFQYLLYQEYLIYNFAVMINNLLTCDLPG